MREKQHDQPVLIVVQYRRGPDESYWIARAYIGERLPETARSSSARGALDKLADRLAWM